MYVQVVELLVQMDCEGCEKRVRRAISKIDGKFRPQSVSSPSQSIPICDSILPSTDDRRSIASCKGFQLYVYVSASHVTGVDSLEVDVDRQKVTVTGYVDQWQVLKAVRRAGRKAEFWPYPYDPEYYPYAAQYLDESTFSSTYNYRHHGSNESIHGYFPDRPYSTVGDETVFLFSDDNVNACSIM